jgi:hypothetical protein
MRQVNLEIVKRSDAAKTFVVLPTGYALVFDRALRRTNDAAD